MGKVKANYDGFNNLKRSLQLLARREVQVGFFDKMYPGIPTDIFPDGYNVGRYVAEVAYLTQINTLRAPARPFMAETIESRGTKIAVRNAIKGILEGAPTHATLDRLGTIVANQMKETIELYDTKEHNSPAWAELKGFDDVLQYTNVMRDSVEHRIEIKV